MTETAILVEHIDKIINTNIFQVENDFLIFIYEKIVINNDKSDFYE